MTWMYLTRQGQVTRLFTRLLTTNIIADGMTQQINPIEAALDPAGRFA